MLFLDRRLSSMTTKKHHPHVELLPATRDQSPILANLLELYIHDFSEFLNVVPGPDGRFGYPCLPLYWSDPNRHPFLVKVDGQWAGFALVKQGSEISANARRLGYGRVLCPSRISPAWNRKPDCARSMDQVSRPVGSARDGVERPGARLLGARDCRICRQINPSRSPRERRRVVGRFLIRLAGRPSG